MFRSIALPLLLAVSLHAQTRVPVLVELFTSEGCSSCPPADTLLADLEKTQPVQNAELIVLSEHVDYWNSLGWRDPFSAGSFTDRQQWYARILNAADVYTPQAVVDGTHAAVGSNRRDLLKDVTVAAGQPKDELSLSVERDGNTLVVKAPASQNGDTWVAIAQARATSQVQHGENGGRTLQHVEVVRSLTKLKNNEVRIPLHADWTSDLSVVAFVQDRSSGKILQVAQKKI